MTVIAAILWFWEAFRGWGQWLLAVVGFAKIAEPALVRHPLRRRILHAVEQDPGIDLSGLVAALQSRLSTVVHHTRSLERARLLSSVHVGRHRRFFVKQPDPAARRRAAFLRDARSRQLWQCLRDTPGLSQRDLARRLGVSIPGALWRLRRLEGAGLVRHDPGSRPYRYFSVVAP